MLMFQPSHPHLTDCERRSDWQAHCISQDRYPRIISPLSNTPCRPLKIINLQSMENPPHQSFLCHPPSFRRFTSASGRTCSTVRSLTPYGSEYILILCTQVATSSHGCHSCHSSDSHDLQHCLPRSCRLGSRPSSNRSTARNSRCKARIFPTSHARGTFATRSFSESYLLQTSSSVIQTSCTSLLHTCGN